jgi:CAAX prenyl protease-like protein
MKKQTKLALESRYERWPWLETFAFLSPMFAHMLVPQFTGYFFDANDPAAESLAMGVTVAVQIVVAVVLYFCFFSTWLSHFKLKISWLSIVVGIVGFGLWVLICNLKIEAGFLSMIGFPNVLSERTAFNPFDQIPDAGWRNLFLVMRFTTLALIVPIAEELMLRGWLVRWIQDVSWQDVRFSNLGWAALAAPTVCSILTHPEIVAAIVWFSLVTWLMVRTKNLWDCVVAHMVTNLLLGIYVVQTGHWELW